MAEVIEMPKLSDTMTEGVVAAWHKNIGEEIASGELLAEIETDKATMEMESFFDGILLHKGVEENGSVPVGSLLAIVGEKGEDISGILESYKNKDTGIGAESTEEASEMASEETVSESATASAQASASSPAAASTTADGRVKASPLAKAMAKENGIDIRNISGSGDGGRIVKRDVEQFIESGGAQQAAAASTGSGPVVGQESYREEPVSQMRKTIARRLAESKFTAPHFYLTMEIEMSRCVQARSSINEVSPQKVSFNDIIIKAVATALRQHPKVNAAWLGDKIRYNDHIHIGMAVAVDEGLLVPVIRFADAKSLTQIGSEARTLAERARDRKLQPADWEGNTFTISNLGMFGIEEFTAIINPPDACILAVGGIKDVPVVKNGQIVPGKTMKVTLSCDHRVVDGAVGSAFLQTLKGLLEDPVRILI